ncbi:MAG TPA: helix-turn-helix domain-containing protein [Baekduia sp.]|uniref:TetR/AcrR family transcriptional regulator n=1 Tax=Baekduia sp. TaxID=2600305 RepID=UPI002D77B376|nr:helix-turn-helix domain-containing protein [Baekduia sp.]HET6508923.1 helix-turn-helix domain-containing protein [Baekduia sp.]
MTASPTRRTQADRRARSRAALLEATARGISRVGYGHLVLSEVAAEAGYTRGALYHQFADKDALVLATLEWVRETWYAEVGTVFDEDLAPADAIAELARRHAIYCRRDIAGVMTAIRVELGARDHPIRDALHAQQRELVARVRALVLAGRRDGTIPPGPPAAALAAATLAAIEAAVITLSGRADVDVDVAQRIARGLIAGPTASARRG